VDPEQMSQAELDAAAEAFSETSVLDDHALASAFDLSLDDDLPVDDPLEPPVLGQTPPPESAVTAPADADDDFEAMLAQAQAQTQSADDLADFDLDIAEPSSAGADEAPVDVAAELAAFDTLPEFDPISELELPDDFDLSLSLEDDSPAAQSFASEMSDVNAELDKLSQSLETPSLERHFGAEDAAAELEPGF